MKQWCLGLSGLVLWLQSAAQRPAYFQQRVDTRISVTLDDKRHFLHATETLTYTNNSPDTLAYIYVHLYPNAYSSDRTAYTDQAVRAGNTAHYFSKAKDRGYIDSLAFNVDGRTATYTTSPGLPDVARLDLPQALPPGGKAIITTPFRVKIPKITSRLGHLRQAYYISQWFPKPAVYDALGWHAMPYLDQGEFYSEIGSYEVDITLPRNYVLMATGNCTDASENAWMDSLAANNPYLNSSLTKSKGTARLLDSIPPSSLQLKTIHFSEDNIHDFAFFADKRFHVRKDTVHITGGAETVTVWAAYLPASDKTWRSVPDYLKKTVGYLSNSVGPYPYKTIKMAEGELRAGGGMEYPTVAVIDRAASKSSSTLRTTIVHEAGHNWFQGILASNERDHAWMDEGINTYYQFRIERWMDSSDRMSSEDESARDLYLSRVLTGDDVPIETTSAAFDPADPKAYGVGVYYKPALMLRWLEAAVGKARFDSVMQAYCSSWQHRHPYPDDLLLKFREGIDKSSRTDQSAWFKDALLTDQPIDVAITSVERKQNGSTDIMLRNRSHIDHPVLGEVLRGDSALAGVWFSDCPAGIRALGNIQFAGDYNAVRTGTEIPDARPANNTWYRNTPFHHKPFRIRPGLGIGARQGGSLYLLPAAGYNAYDGFMIGGVLHNLRTVPTKFRYALVPLYAIGSKSLTGIGTAGYFIYPHSGAFKEIVLQADVKSFHYNKTDYNTSSTLRSRYTKMAPSLLLTFRRRNVLQTAVNTILLKGYGIREEFAAFTLDPADSMYKPQLRNVDQRYGLLRFSHDDTRTFNSFSYAAEAQLGRKFAKISLEGKLRIDYNVPKKSFYIRAFAGKFIPMSASTTSETYRYWLATTYNGQNDYLYDEQYFGRNETEGIAGQQVSAGKEGGFKLQTPYYSVPLGRSDNYLLSLNLKTDLPLKSLPIRAFFDVATYANAEEISPTGAKLLYEGGLELYIGKRFTLHVPLILAKDYTEYLKSVQGKDAFWKRITFTLNLEGFLGQRSGDGSISL